MNLTPAQQATLDRFDAQIGSSPKASGNVHTFVVSIVDKASRAVLARAEHGHEPTAAAQALAELVKCGNPHAARAAHDVANNAARHADSVAADVKGTQ